MSGTDSLASLRLAPRSRYLSVALMGAQGALAYPRAVVLNLLSTSVWLAISYYVWGAVFSHSEQVGGFDWARMRTYVLLVHAANLLLNSAVSVYRVMMSVWSGEIASELLRPYDYLKAQLALSVGSALVGGGLGLAVAAGLGFTLVDALPPVSATAAVLFGVSLVLAFLIKFLVGFGVSLLSFRTMNWLGLTRLETALVGILSGALVPLELYPEWLRSVALVFPFHGIIHTPLSIYLGDLQGMALLRAVGLQAFWVVGLWALVRWLWAPSLRALVIQRG
jgi:ABC-2 type transport system permease protein